MLETRCSRGGAYLPLALRASSPPPGTLTALFPGLASDVEEGSPRSSSSPVSQEALNEKGGSPDSDDYIVASSVAKVPHHIQQLPCSSSFMGLLPVRSD